MIPVLVHFFRTSPLLIRNRILLKCKKSSLLALASASGLYTCLSTAPPKVNPLDVWNDSTVTSHGLFRQQISSSVKTALEKLPNINDISIDDCRNLRSNFIEQYSSSQRFVDANVLITFFENPVLLHFGYVYVRYLLQEDLFNPASVRLGAELLFRAHVQRVPIEKSVYDQFLKMIDEKFSDFAEMMSVPKFLVQLCTDYWRDSLRDFRTKEISLKLSKTANFSAAVACFHNDQPEMGFDVLQSFTKDEDRHVLTKSIHDAAFECMQRLSASVESQQRAIDAFSRFVEVSRHYELHGLHPDYVDVVKRIIESWNTYTVSETTVDESGYCQTCRKALEKESMTFEECAHLEKLLYEILKGKDIYRQTTPQELMTFIGYVDRLKPFDVVVDGLNIAYRYGRIFTSDVRAEKLIQAVSLLKEKGYGKILVIAKQHLFKKCPDKLSNLKLLASTFLCKNESLDDLFLLYAAAASGQNCYIASSDCFSFLYNNDKKLRFLIDRWKRTRLITCVGESTFAPPNFEFPPEYKLRLQRSPNGFHLPLVSPTKNLVGLPHFTECSWLCVQNKADS